MNRNPLGIISGSIVLVIIIIIIIKKEEKTELIHSPIAKEINGQEYGTYCD